MTILLCVLCIERRGVSLQIRLLLSAKVFILLKYTIIENLLRSLFLVSACNCFGHSNECEYDENVDNQKLSLDIAGNFDGGGVCKNCRHHTEGINCNKCQSGFFRPYGKQPDAIDACQCKATK